MVTYQRAVHLQSRIGHEADDDSILAIVPDSDFKDGVIEVDVAGAPIPQAPSARGFIGVAFHVQAHADSFECLSTLCQAPGACAGLRNEKGKEPSR